MFSGESVLLLFAQPHCSPGSVSSSAAPHTSPLATQLLPPPGMGMRYLMSGLAFVPVSSTSLHGPPLV